MRKGCPGVSILQQKKCVEDKSRELVFLKNQVLMWTKMEAALVPREKAWASRKEGGQPTQKVKKITLPMLPEAQPGLQVCRFVGESVQLWGWEPQRHSQNSPHSGRRLKFDVAPRESWTLDGESGKSQQNIEAKGPLQGLRKTGAQVKIDSANREHKCLTYIISLNLHKT